MPESPPLQIPDCPTCRVAMEPGFLLDRGHRNSPSQVAWTEGEPERSWWQGLERKGSERIPAVTCRCPRCGLLQSYARPDWSGPAATRRSCQRCEKP